MRALCFENARKQEEVLRESGVIFLMRLLRSHTSDRVVCSCVRLLGTLFLSPAHTANERVQLAFAEANLVPLLAEYVRAAPSVDLRVQVPYRSTLLCHTHSSFTTALLSIIQSPSDDIDWSAREATRRVLKHRVS